MMKTTTMTKKMRSDAFIILIQKSGEEIPCEGCLSQDCTDIRIQVLMHEKWLNAVVPLINESYRNLLFSCVPFVAIVVALLYINKIDMQLYIGLWHSF